jgi:hypothetical protein
MTDAPVWDRTAEDIGNIVELGHVNTRVNDQRMATLFYVAGLGLTRDPYLMTSVQNMWINVGRAQFHLPSGPPQVVRGVTGLVVPDLDALLVRLAAARRELEGSRFSVREVAGAVETTCPWGNRIRCHAPDPARFGPVTLGMPYVEFDVPVGTRLEAIARFYREILGGIAGVAGDPAGAYAWAIVGDGNRLIFRQSAEALPEYDGHHVQIALADFSGPHRRLSERGLITEESNQHQYRFQDIVDLDSGAVVFTVEHEVRSMRHPLFGRALVNRDPGVTNRTYAHGHEALEWKIGRPGALPLDPAGA